MKTIIAALFLSIFLNIGCIEEDVECLGNECDTEIRSGDRCHYEYKDRINTELNRRETYVVYGVVECDSTDCDCRWYKWVDQTPE